MPAQDLHEPAALPSLESQNLHRGIRSLIEELERTDVTNEAA